ncbi:MAG: hypothetical protein JSR78_09770 [Proteobacteria bacterium]|nr:hypothetical protein [Pseudomonadota bacterium]
MNDATAHTARERFEGLLKEYGEVGANHRKLTDIRFRLLAFLPTASIILNIFKPEISGFQRVALALSGLAVSIGLITYNKRNDQIYFALENRAKTIERELHIPDGAFSTRPKPLTIFGSLWPIQHPTAIFVLYTATIAIWLFLVLDSSAAALRDFPFAPAWYTLYAEILPPGYAHPVAQTVKLVLAVALAYGGTLAFDRSVRAQEKKAEAAASRAIRARGRPYPATTNPGARPP